MRKKVNYSSKLYKQLRIKFAGLNAFSKFFRKIPVLIWGLLACSAILVFGFCIGYLTGVKSETPGSPYAILKEGNKKLMNLIDGYSQLSGLYFNQGQDVSIVLNKDMAENHPEEIIDALQSINQKRDMINVQLGRLYELRKAAGLIEYGDFASIKN